MIASLVVEDEKDQQDLLLKAVFDADAAGLMGQETAPLIVELRALVEKIL